MMADDFTLGLVCSRGADPAQGGRKHNEDNYLICQDGLIRYRQGQTEKVLRKPGHGLLMAVADGMGGHRHGELASSAAVQALCRLYYRKAPRDPESALHAFLVRGHRKLREKAVTRQMGDIGTTLATCWIIDHWLYWAHVGDSRIYLLRGETITQLTRDHTRGEFARRDGRASPMKPKSLAQNFLFGSRGLGSDDDIRIDAGTDTGSQTLFVGDHLLLCSDGLSNFVPSHRIARAVWDAENPAACAQWLVDRAIAAGSDDNITVMILRVERSPHEPDMLTVW